MSTYYFAYGSNMDKRQMSSRCPRAEYAGTTLLPDYRFIINERGYATVCPAPGFEAPGLLWCLQPSDEIALDSYEGYAHGLYDKGYRIVRDVAGNEFQALVYIDHRNHTLGTPREGYLERIVAAAELHELPERHQHMLKAWPTKATFKFNNQLVNRVKSGCEFSRSIGNHKETLSRLLKLQRDALILKALDAAAESDGQTTFQALLENIAMREMEDAVNRLERERAGELGLECAALEATLRRIETLLQQNEFSAISPEANKRGELAGLGIIITDNPRRPHHPEDRFIVTKHAPVLSALWDRIFEGKHGWLSITSSFLDAFACIAEDCDKDTISDVAHRALERVRESVLARRDAIWREMEFLQLH